MGSLITYMEKNFSPKALQREKTTKPNQVPVLQNGTRIIIVGGGIAGSSLARELLILAGKEKIKIDIKLINSNSCNYCGGLITNLSRDTLEGFYGLTVPSWSVLRRIKTCLYLNGEGSVAVDLKKDMIATLRTSKFGIQGFDDSIKSRITEGLPPETREMLTIFEPTIVQKIWAPRKPDECWKVQISRKDQHNRPVILEGEVLVMASGFKSLNRPMMSDFQEQTGYTPPPLMDASVTEICTDEALVNRIEDQILIVDNIIPGAMVAVIPKSDNWVTLTSLGKKLTVEDVDRLFGSPIVKKYLDLPNASRHLRCKIICPAQVFVGSSPKFYGNRWAAIGDLTGYGRVLKDGYFASFLSVHLVANTLFYHGDKAEDFKQYYHRPLKKFLLDNHFGMLLFNLNLRLNTFSWFRKFLLSAAALESRKDNAGGFVHSSIRALATGDLSYRLIALFFVIGLGRAVFSPRQLWRQMKDFAS